MAQEEKKERDPQFSPDKLFEIFQKYPQLEEQFKVIQDKYAAGEISRDHHDYEQRRAIRVLRREKATSENDGFEPMPLPFDDEYLLERLNDPTKDIADKQMTANLMVYSSLNRISQTLCDMHQLTLHQLQMAAQSQRMVQMPLDLKTFNQNPRRS